MSVEHDEQLLPGVDTELEQDLAAALGSATPPEGFYDDLHRQIDEGLAHRPRRLFPVGVVALAGTALAAAAIVLALIGPWRHHDDSLQARGGGAPEVEFTVLSVTEDGEDSHWLRDGDQVAADRWLAFRVLATPDSEVALVRMDDGGLEVFARARAPQGEDALTTVSLDTGYALATLEGEQSFGCAVSAEPLDDITLVLLSTGQPFEAAVAWSSVTLDVVSP